MMTGSALQEDIAVTTRALLRKGRDMGSAVQRDQEHDANGAKIKWTEAAFIQMGCDGQRAALEHGAVRRSGQARQTGIDGCIGEKGISSRRLTIQDTRCVELFGSSRIGPENAIDRPSKFFAARENPAPVNKIGRALSNCVDR